MQVYIYIQFSRVAYPKKSNSFPAAFLRFQSSFIKIPHLIPFQSDTPEFSYSYQDLYRDTVFLGTYTNRYFRSFDILYNY